MEAVAAERQVLVEQLSLRDELANVVRLAVTIVFAVWLYLASALGSGGAARRSLLPYQGLVQNLPVAEQRMFRELQEGLLEAERLRSDALMWPTTSALAEAGVPPFAFDPTAKGTTYRWAMIRDGNYVNYMGLPDRSDGAAWLVWIQEPERGIPPDQPNEDEEHHRLLDGTMLHVSTWKHAPAPPPPTRAVRVPQVEGWTQLYAVGPGGASR
jgi:hypothetical protein